MAVTVLHKEIKLAGSDPRFGADVAWLEGIAADLDESKMAIRVPFADGRARDGVGDLLEIEGINLSRHEKNPIVLFDHGKDVKLPIAQSRQWDLDSGNYTGPYTVVLDPLGKVATALDFFYQGKGMAGVERKDEYDHALFCQQLYHLMSMRFVGGGSIGYQVIQAAEIPADYQKGTPKGLHLLKVLKLEHSVVITPANQDTVRKTLAMPNCCGKPLSHYLIKSLQPFVGEKKVQMGYEAKANEEPEYVEVRKKKTAAFGSNVQFVYRVQLVARGGRVLFDESFYDEDAVSKKINEYKTKYPNIDVDTKSLDNETKANEKRPVYTGRTADTLTPLEKEKYEWLKANQQTLPTKAGVDGGITTLTGVRTSILSRLKEAGLISGSIWLGGKVTDLQVKALEDSDNTPFGDTKAMGEYELAYRIPGKGSWKRKVFKTEEERSRFIDKVVEKEGNDVEFQTRDPDNKSLGTKANGGIRHLGNLSSENAEKFKREHPEVELRPQKNGYGDQLGFGVYGPEELLRTLFEWKKRNQGGLKSIRQKYKTVKGLKRSLKKSSPGAAMIHVLGKDLDATEQLATKKGLKFAVTGSKNGRVKVKLIGDDNAIDEVTKTYGYPVGMKSMKAKTKDLANPEDLNNLDTIDDTDSESVEPYGAQVLRHWHDVAGKLMKEGDEHVRLLDHEHVKNHLTGHLSGLEKFMGDTEKHFKKHYKDLPPLAGAESDDDTLEDDDSDDEVEVGDVDVKEGGIPDASADDLPEPSPEEAVEGMETADDPIEAEKNLEGKKKAVCTDCGKPECKCDKKGLKGKKKDLTQDEAGDIAEDVVEQTNDTEDVPVPEEVKSCGFADHEKKSIGNASGFLKGIGAPGSNFGDNERMESYHYHKTLEGIGQVEEMADESQQTKDIDDDDLPNQKEKIAPLVAAGIGATVGGMMGDKSSKLSEASEHFKQLSNERAFGDMHREKSIACAKALDDLMGGEEEDKDLPEDDAMMEEEMEVPEPGDMGEKHLLKIVTERGKRLDILTKQLERLSI